MATGTVVVGAVSRADDAEAKLAVGETPNLAARLQGLAGPDEVVIAPSTRRLVGAAFQLSDMGAHSLKGIAQPVRAWRVHAVHRPVGRFEAAHEGVALTPLVGRQKEVALLLRRWHQARDGEGQVVLVGGEPGIGKSRILSVLREKLAGEGAATNELPVLAVPHEQCVLSAHRQPGTGVEVRAGRGRGIETQQAGSRSSSSTTAGQDRMYGSSLRCSPSPPSSATVRPNMTPQRFKDETLRALVDLVEAAARKQPSLLLFEDAHWADPTSLEVLDLLVERTRNIPLLLVLTHRPEFQNRWANHNHVSALNLSKLTKAQSATIVSRIAKDKALPGNLLEQIVGKTDGIPLFVEELTKRYWSRSRSRRRKTGTSTWET